MNPRILQPVRLSLRSLLLHRLRSVLTILGVVFGVGSVIAMLAVGEGARSEAVRQIEELGATNIILRSVKPVAEGDVSWEGAVPRYGLTTGDLTRVARTVPTVLSATPMREHREELSCETRKLEGRVVGVTPGYQKMHQIQLRRGRFITDLDNQCGATVVVLGAQVANTLFPFEDPIGRSVRLGSDRYYRVVGVTAPRGPSPAIGSGLPAQDYNRDAYIAFLTDRVRFGEILTSQRTGSTRREHLQISQLTIAVDQRNHVNQTAQIITGMLQQSHKEPDTAITVPLDLLEKAERSQRMFTLVLGAIASISLLVGGIGIMNIMLATVVERTREIGIRRALGAKRGHIVTQFLLETVVLSSIGGLLGLSVGVALSHGLAYFFSVPTQIRAWALLLALAISVAVGLVFGTYPARRAARMDPIEALRHE